MSCGLICLAGLPADCYRRRAFSPGGQSRDARGAFHAALSFMERDAIPLHATALPATNAL